MLFFRLLPQQPKDIRQQFSKRVMNKEFIRRRATSLMTLQSNASPPPHYRKIRKTNV